MKCQEANEWMNRYLDHDLSETETKQLFRHLDSCPDCAETFDMMKRISAGLDSLPDVKPKFSLVDSILPRLDELDRTGGQAEIKQESFSSPSEMKPVAAELNSKEQADKSAQDHKVRSLPARRRQLWTRVAGGAAAAVILGFCIYQFQPKEIPNAEPAVQDSTLSSVYEQDSSANPDASADAASKESTASGQSAAIAGDSAAAGGTDQTSSAAPEQTPQPAGNAVLPSAKNPAVPSGSSIQSTEDKSKDKETASPDRSTGQKSGKPADPVQTMPAEGNKTPSTTPATSSPNVPSGDSTPALDRAASDGSPAASDSPGSIQSLVPPVGADAKKDSIFMGIQSMVESDVWDSPNGKYTAKLEDGHLNVYLISSTGDLTRIYDDPVNGEWLAGSAFWSEDGSVFYYTVMEDGASVESEVDASQAAAMIQK